MKSRQKTRKMVLLALFCCIEVVLMLTPLGYIPLGVVRATTLHIPVILAGILLGGHAGGIVGLVFGVSSVIVNTLTPTVTSFVFSPFYSVGEIHGGAASLLIALGPRILLGYSASWIFRMMMKLTGRLSGSLTVSALLSTFLHTALVMLGIFVFFSEPYAAIREIPVSALAGLLMTVIFTNGVLEMLIAAFLVLAVGKVMIPYLTGKRSSI